MFIYFLFVILLCLIFLILFTLFSLIFTLTFLILLTLNMISIINVLIIDFDIITIHSNYANFPIIIATLIIAVFLVTYFFNPSICQWISCVRRISIWYVLLVVHSISITFYSTQNLYLPIVINTLFDPMAVKMILNYSVMDSSP